MAPLAVAFTLLLLLTGTLGVLGRRAARVEPAPGDRASSAVLGIAHTVTVLAGALFPLLHLGGPAFGTPLAWAAVGVMALAFGLQLWAMHTLGAHFTLTLGTTEHHPLIERGPYRHLRHPGYLAQILFFLGFTVASRNLLTLALGAPAIAFAYAFRIRQEERGLAAALGEPYRAYLRRTARLLPGIF